jgi:hypothetical protein
MTEEDQGSVFGGIAEAAGAAWDAATEVGQAVGEAGVGVAELSAGWSAHVAATGAELFSQSEMRDELDNVGYDLSKKSDESFARAGEDLSAAGNDIVGD